MKRILSLLFAVLLFAPTYAKSTKHIDNYAQKIASNIINLIKHNKNQVVASSKTHVIDLSKLHSSKPTEERIKEHFVNNGGFFWNLSSVDKTDIDAHVNSYAPTFKDPQGTDIEYIIIIGSIFNFADVESNLENTDWKKLIDDKKNNRININSSSYDLDFYRKVQQKVSDILQIQYPSKYIINWFLSVFTANQDGTYKVQTKTFVSQNTGYTSNKFGFASLDNKLTAIAANTTKKDWIKKNIDFDANTIRYYKELDASVFIVNKSGKTLQESQFLKDLFEGKKAQTIGNTTYRNIKILLLVTDEQTDAKDREAINAISSSTHIIVKINFINNKPSITTKFPNDAMKLVFEDFIKKMFNTSTFWERFGNQFPEFGEEFCTVLYDVFDCMARGINQAKIPEWVWNCCHADYKPTYADVFGFLLNPIVLALQSEVGNTLGGSNFVNCGSFSITRAQFAMYVGVWNGFVDIAAGIPTMLKLVVSAGIDAKHQINPKTNQPYRNDWGLFQHEIDKNGGGLIGFFKLIGNSLKELHDPSRPCVFAHSLGSDFLNIIAAFLTAGESLASSSIGSLARTVFVTLERLDVLSMAIGKVGGIASKYIISPLVTPVTQAVKQSIKIAWKDATNAAAHVIEIAIENGKTIIRVLDATQKVFRDFDWSFTKRVQALIKTVNGSYYPIDLGLPNVIVNPSTFANDLMNFKDRVKVQIKEVLKDKDGLPIVNDKGQGLAVVTREGSNGSTDEVIAIIEDAEGIAREGFNLLDETNKFIDIALENDYQKYLQRKARQGKTPRSRLDWKEVTDYWKYDSPMARGNAFDDKAMQWYNINELNLILEDGKTTRLDSYVPPYNGNKGEIISRKATDLEDIELSTFEGYLKEMNKKYSPGTRIRSNAYPDLDGKILEGDMFLEIPDTNKSFNQIKEYEELAQKYNIVLRYRLE